MIFVSFAITFKSKKRAKRITTAKVGRAITICGALQNRSPKQMHKNNTKSVAKRLRATTFKKLEER